MCLGQVSRRLITELISDTQVGIGSTDESRQSLQMLTNHIAIVKGGLFWPVAAIELPEEVMPMGAGGSQSGARSQS